MTKIEIEKAVQPAPQTLTSEPLGLGPPGFSLTLTCLYPTAYICLAPILVACLPMSDLDEGNGSGAKPRADVAAETEHLGPTTQSHKLARNGDAVEDRERDNDDGEERLR